MRVTEQQAYEPSRSLLAKLGRKMTPGLARRPMRVSLERPVISFTFDDFPRSAITNGLDVLEAEGWQATLYVAAGLMDVENHHGRNFSGKDVVALEDKGHEIACHTYSHVDCTQLPLDEVLAEIDKNREALRGLGVKGPIEHFAYPYGETRRKVKRGLEGRFKSMRGIEPYTHRVDADLNGLYSAGLFSRRKLDHALRLIRGQKQAPGWLTLFAHDIRDNPSEWGCTPDEFKQVVEAAKSVNALVLPVGEAIEHIEALNDEY